MTDNAAHELVRTAKFHRVGDQRRPCEKPGCTRRHDWCAWCACGHVRAAGAKVRAAGNLQKHIDDPTAAAA